MGPASGHSGTGCSPNSLCALAPRLTRHSAGLQPGFTVVPGCVGELEPHEPGLFVCLNDAVGAVEQTAFPSWSGQALADLGAKEALSVLTMNFPTRLCKGLVLFSQSCWLQF